MGSAALIEGLVQIVRGYKTMFEFIAKIFSMLMELWGKLPESAKEAIIKAAVDTFEAIFRAYFKSQKGGEANA